MVIINILSILLGCCRGCDFGSIFKLDALTFSYHHLMSVNGLNAS